VERVRHSRALPPKIGRVWRGNTRSIHGRPAYNCIVYVNIIRIRSERFLWHGWLLTSARVHLGFLLGQSLLFHRHGPV